MTLAFLPKECFSRPLPNHPMNLADQLDNPILYIALRSCVVTTLSGVVKEVCKGYQQLCNLRYSSSLRVRVRATGHALHKTLLRRTLSYRGPKSTSRRFLCLTHRWHSSLLQLRNPGLTSQQQCHPRCSLFGHFGASKRLYAERKTTVEAHDGRFGVTDPLTTLVKKGDKDSDPGTCMAYNLYSRAVWLIFHRTTLAKQRCYID